MRGKGGGNIAASRWAGRCCCCGKLRAGPRTGSFAPCHLPARRIWCRCRDSAPQRRRRRCHRWPLTTRWSLRGRASPGGMGRSVQCSLNRHHGTGRSWRGASPGPGRNRCTEPHPAWSLCRRMTATCSSRSEKGLLENRIAVSTVLLARCRARLRRRPHMLKGRAACPTPWPAGYSELCTSLLCCITAL